MRLLPRLVALLLLALWLPATGHCALEASGLLTTACQDACGAQHCTHDNCGAVEAAHYRGIIHAVQVPSPALRDAVGLIIAAMAAPPLKLAPVIPPATERPRDWVATWHFVRRTAPPARAPTEICA